MKTPAQRVNRWTDGVVQLVADLLTSDDFATEGRGLSPATAEALTGLLREQGTLLFWEGHGYALAEQAQARLGGDA